MKTDNFIVPDGHQVQRLYCRAFLYRRGKSWFNKKTKQRHLDHSDSCLEHAHWLIRRVIKESDLGWDSWVGSPVSRTTIGQLYDGSAMIMVTRKDV